MKEKLKNALKKSKILYVLGIYIMHYGALISDVLFPVRGKNNQTDIFSRATLIKVKKSIRGDNNKVIIGDRTRLQHVKIRIRGNNNTLLIENDCKIGKNSSFWIEGNNSQIIIRQNCTFSHTVHICVQENEMKTELGEDCMLANNIIIRTSDSHPYYDMDTKNRLNKPKSILIGYHVWICPQVIIMKGVEIGDGAIIGSRCVVTKNIPKNVLVAGIPAKVVKEHVYWTRERLF